MRTRNIRQVIYLLIVFIVFFSSYAFNIFNIVPSYYTSFDRTDELYVIVRLDRSKHEGIFKYGGLTGEMVDKNNTDTIKYEGDKRIITHYSNFLSNIPIPGEFKAYKSQTGGQAILYGVLQKVSPLRNGSNIQIFRCLNVLILAFIFTLFIGWCYRNFNFVSSLIPFVCLILSPLLMMYGFNLWWTLWSFYLPFVTMLLVLEQKNKHEGKYSDKKILLCLFAAVFVKCFFTGFEYITSTLIAALCPILYYQILNKSSFKQIIVFIFKAGIVCLLAVFSEMLILITQIKFLEGSFVNGVNHILDSYIRRATYDKAEIVYSYWDITMKYLGGSVYTFKGILSFGSILLCIVAGSIILYFFSKKYSTIDVFRKNAALIITTFFAISGPFSWFFIFKEHSTFHSNYIVWYLPFLLFGFLIIGVALSTIILKIRNKT